MPGPVVAVVQARMGSTRLPGKSLAPIGGRSILAHLLGRVALAQSIDEVMVATTVEPRDDAIVAAAEQAGVRVFRGSEDDVLSRYVGAARDAGAETVVRLTADCPLMTADVVDRVVAALAPGVDLATNAPPQGRTYPDGLDVEVFPRASLERLDAATTDPRDREHVTRGFHSGDWVVREVHLGRPLGDVNITVDTAEDLERCRAILESLGDGEHLDLDTLLAQVAPA